jgi:hypothetical protein
LSRDNVDISAIRTLLNQQLLRKTVTESAMYFAEAVWIQRVAGQSACVNPFLHFDMRNSLELQIALHLISAEILPHGPFDIDGVCVMALNQV